MKRTALRTDGRARLTGSGLLNKIATQEAERREDGGIRLRPLVPSEPKLIRQQRDKEGRLMAPAFDHASITPAPDAQR